MLDRFQISLFNWQDLIVFPLLLLILFFFYKRRVLELKKSNNTLYKIFFVAFFFKLFCTILHIIIIQFLYDKLSDSVNYYTEALNIKSQLTANPKASLWDFYFNREAFSNNTGLEFFEFGTNETANVPLIILPLTFLFFNSYLCISFFLGFFSLMACHKLYIVFADVFPTCKIEAAIASVFLPGVCFWSSILLKDCLSLIGLGYTVYFFWKTAFKKELKVKNIIGLVLAIALVYYFKPYILVILFTFFLWYMLSLYAKLKNAFAKIMALSFFSVIFIFSISIAINELNKMETGPLAKFNTETIADQLSGFQNSYETEAGENTSSFSMNIDFSNPISLLGGLPKALMAVFFQPFPWEAKKPIMLLSAAESLFISFLFLYTFLKSKIIGFFRIIFKNPFLLSFFIFCIFFGAIVGLATPNFGTLARYKIPCMPFIVFILLVIKSKLKDEDLIRKNKLKPNFKI